MKRQGRPNPKSRETKDEQESSQPAEAVVAQQSGNEPSEEEEPPREGQDMAPDQERGSGGQPEAQGAGLEVNLLELLQPKTGGKKGDGLDVRGEFVTSLEPTLVPEAGEGPPEV
ncbi:P antigen family member 3-like [Marmota monax]|uniref:P antigen family member 3-like n=1 Tax=Marmota monax TaxID=9995 RepID=UPI001EAFA022|nr:P antigen family member 3-like [Marmota monax]XP_046277999.1 P antigen family member 3-like [Marmota monax]